VKFVRQIVLRKSIWREEVECRRHLSYSTLPTRRSSPREFVTLPSAALSLEKGQIESALVVRFFNIFFANCLRLQVP